MQTNVIEVADLSKSYQLGEHAVNALQGVIMRHAEVITGGCILSSEDDITKAERVAAQAAFAAFMEGERTGFGTGGDHVEAERMRRAGSNQRLASRGGKSAASAGVEVHAIGSVRGICRAGRLPGDVGAGAETRID